MIDVISIVMLSGWTVTAISGSVSYLVLLRRRQIPTQIVQLSHLQTTTTSRVGKRNSKRAYLRLDTCGSRDARVINVYNLNSNILQYKFIKPVNHISHEINLYWHQEYILRDVVKNADIATLYSASFGGGGYIQFFEVDREEKKQHWPYIFQYIVERISLKRSSSEVNEQRPERRPRLNDIIYISSKLMEDIREFKLLSYDRRNEQVKLTYRWFPATKCLKRVSKYEKNEGPCVAAIRDFLRVGEYTIEIDPSYIDTDIILSTSLIFSLNKG